MDAFYASVEQRDRSELKGKPVIVGGDPNSRGVVAACSYEAREFGIYSAMASSTAYRLCPDAVFIRPRFDAYRAVSSEIRKIFHEYTDLVEPVDNASVIIKFVKPLLSKTEAGKKKVRLLGISVSNFDDQDSVALKSRQLLLPLKFPEVADRKSENLLEF
jgi:nucleotidyltransferase/DNA polymerase involved in DNA repair